MRNWFSRHPIWFMAFYLVFYLSVFHWLDAYSTWLNGVGLALSVIMCLALIRQDSTAP